MLLARRFLAVSKCRFFSSKSNKGFTVLGIETSCDDTAVGVVSSDGHVLSNVVNSQLQVHLKAGGIIPRVAGSLHSQNIQQVFTEALQQSGLDLDEVSHVAVTVGPGLAPSLKSGVQFAQSVCRQHSKPLMAIHHMEAHALTPRMQQEIPFPYLVLLVSGGHCILGIVKNPGEFLRLGSTGDDSPGEAFDKVARSLELGQRKETSQMAGGAAIEHMAKRGNPWKYPHPDVMLTSRCCNFSFSGLKTAVGRNIDRHLENGGELTEEFVADVASSFQLYVTKHLGQRTHRALQYCAAHYPTITHLVVSGGVAQNKFIQDHLRTLSEENDLLLSFPPPHLCSDNGVMIAWCAAEYVKAGLAAQIERTDFQTEHVEFIPKWPLGLDISQEVVNAKIPNRKYRLSTWDEQLNSHSNSIVTPPAVDST